MSLEIDFREFQKSIKEVIEKHKKDAPKYLNKKALSIITGSKGHPGAIKLTPAADKSEIKSLTDKQLAHAVNKRAKAKGERLTREEFSKRIKKERSRRMSAVGYTRGPGWDKAAKALGGRGVKTQSGFPKSKAAKGYGKKASAANLASIIANTAPAASEIGREALQKAVNNQARDMAAYGTKELLDSTFKKHSAK